MTYLNAVKHIEKAPADGSSATSPEALRHLWELLGISWRGLKYLRLTGSNGKTVCAELLQSTFSDSCYTVGYLNISDHPDPREAIQIQSKPLPHKEFAQYVNQVVLAQKSYNQALSQAEKDQSIVAETDNEVTSSNSTICLNRSELLLSVALLAFRDKQCSFCIIESVPSPSDPTHRLPPPFAAAICGTIPSDNPAEMQQIRSYIVHGIQEIISAPQNQDAYRIISETCAAINCRLTIPTKSELNVERLALSGSEFSYCGEPYRLSLCGKFQINNALVVLEILNMLARRGYSLSKQQIFQGLQKATLPAKFEILSVSPTIIADSTHSAVAVQTVCEALSEFRPMIGSSLRLCLPKGTLTDQYLQCFAEHGYTVQELISYGPSDTAKDVVTRALDGLSSNEILLISGPYGFTIQLRHEILKRFGL